MTYLIVALLGAACGTILNWICLLPIVTIVAVVAGYVGAVRGDAFSEVAWTTLLLVCTLEFAWISSATAAVFLLQRYHRKYGSVAPDSVEPATRNHSPSATKRNIA